MRSHGLDRFGRLRPREYQRFAVHPRVGRCTIFDSLTRGMSTVRGSVIVVGRGIPVRAMRLFAERVFLGHHVLELDSGRASTGCVCMRDGRFVVGGGIADGGLTSHHVEVMIGMV